MIREADPGSATDIAAAVRFTGDLRAALVPDAPFDPITTEQTIRALARSARGLVLLLDIDGPQGVLLAAAQPFAFAPVLSAEELLWWVEPAQRGPWAQTMLNGFEAWASDIGARITGLSFTGKSAEALFRRRGYAPGEQTFYRVT